MRKLAVLVGVLGLLGLVLGCDRNSYVVYQTPIRQREEVFKRATALYPIPIPSDFPLRRDLVEYTMRESKPGPWYVYLQTDAGTYSAYYVAKSLPQNACNFLSETKTSSSWSSSIAVDAPSLDGIYYGGTGASGACDAWFWFDAGTNALIITRFKTTVSDQPLAIDVPEIKIAPQRR